MSTTVAAKRKRAAGAGESNPLSSSDLTCGGCYQPYVDHGLRQPMMLQCGHTLCKTCTTMRPDFNTCPDCRQPIKRPPGSIPPNYALMHALVPPAAAGADADVSTQQLLQRWNLSVALRLRLSPEHLAIGSTMGQGGTGLLARGTLEGNEVAVKVLKLPNTAASQLSALKRELMVLLHVTATCPHACRYLGLTYKDGELCLVMPMYPSTLADCIRQAGSGGLLLPQALDMAQDIAKGLEELHGQGVVAGSLKPQNVLLTAQGTAVLSDYGLSQAISRTHAQSTQLAWTYNYLSPEQMEEGGAVSSKADVWAWACTLIHMLTGEAPMEGLRHMQIIRKVSGAREAPSVPPGLPPRLTQLLTSCLQFDPNSRPTAAEVSQALKLMTGHGDLAATPDAAVQIRITVKDQSGEEVEFKVQPSVRMGKVMCAYTNLKGVGADAVRFLVEGRCLEMSKSVAGCGLKDGDCVDVVVIQCGDVGQWEDAADGTAGCASPSNQLLLGGGATGSAVHLLPADIQHIMHTARSPPLPPHIPSLPGGGDSGGVLQLLPDLLLGCQCAALIAHLDAQLRSFCAANPDANQVFDGPPTFAPKDFKLLLTRPALDALIPPHVSSAMESSGTQLLSRLGVPQSQASLSFILRRRALAPSSSRPQCIPFHRDSSLVVVNVALNTDYEGGDLMFIINNKLECPSRPAGWGTAHDLNTVHGVSHLSAGVRYNLFAVFEAAGKAA